MPLGLPSLPTSFSVLGSPAARRQHPQLLLYRPPIPSLPPGLSLARPDHFPLSRQSPFLPLGSINPWGLTQLRCQKALFYKNQLNLEGWKKSHWAPLGTMSSPGQGPAAGRSGQLHLQEKHLEQCWTLGTVLDSRCVRAEPTLLMKDLP